MPFSLIETLRKRYLDTIQSVKPTNGRWKILVVDKHSKNLIEGVLKTFEILELGVQQIDSIETPRQPSPNLEAIYILAPTAKNVDRIISDFAPAQPPSRKGPPVPSGGVKYAGAHLFFIDALDDALVNVLTSSPAASYLRQLVELFTNIWPEEPQVYTLRPPNPRSLFTLYGPPERSVQDAIANWEDELGWISKSLVNLLATLGEKPYIRYYNPSTTPLGPAAAAKEHLYPPRPRGTMFITERAMDLQAPLLHEFTYQAMCNDLLDIKDNKYIYSFKDQSGEHEEKEVTLSEDDKVWVEVRHMHMKDALDKLIHDFKAYATEHGHLTNGSSLNDMKDMLASLPHLKESKEKLSLHLSMAETCMDLFEKKQLPLAASVEQCCSTGMTAEGKTPKSIVEEMVPLLDDRAVSTTDKLRIIALYVLYRDGVPDEDRRRLYQHAKLGLNEMDAVNNLIHLGANVAKDSGKKRKVLFKQPLDENDYDISRYRPLVKLMLEDAVANKLDQTVFPYMGESPSTNAKLNGSGLAAYSTAAPTSLRSAKPSWQKPKSKAVVENRPRMIVFVAGGMTHSEIRSAYAVSEAHSKDVIIGSTSIYTPKAFIHDLSRLDRGGSSGSNQPPPSSAYEGKQARLPKRAPDPRQRDDRYAYEPPDAVVAPPPRSAPSYPTHRPAPPPLTSQAALMPPAMDPRLQPPMPSPSLSSYSKPEKEKKKGFFSRSKK
ncbi:uncharacterized protein MELLADRAFT_114806 [Melampsora larici-populina 98AG31]|uniref:Sec1-like protein n=1 Tax=Melampsora larici-populina (strain 98AG31 / pathotype 3-4-7) TaxID=747676 RepID=F4R3D3_MELLP|nr:uncharacterized protein MELLADRAFT_114806 [Melampsora larici-populina 98AG31]EGG12609.1 hypothetical protein MELLADRAFT_114806 [Melampsora larici-populina 98AG31]